MTKDNPSLAPTALAAADIAKYRHQVLIEAPGRARRRRLTVVSNKADNDRLAEALAAYGGPVLIGFEATGDYHRGLAYRLLSAVFELRLVSFVALARTREALHNDWDKNDPKDAQVILHMLRFRATQRYVDPLAARWRPTSEEDDMNRWLPPSHAKAQAEAHIVLGAAPVLRFFIRMISPIRIPALSAPPSL